MLALLAALSVPAHACFGCHYDTLITLVAVGEDGSLILVTSMGGADSATRFLPGGERTLHDLNAEDPTSIHTEDRAAEPRLNYAGRMTEKPQLPPVWASTYTLLTRDEAGTWAGEGWTVKTTRTRHEEEEGMGFTQMDTLDLVEGPCPILRGHPQTVEADGTCKLALPN